MNHEYIGFGGTWPISTLELDAPAYFKNEGASFILDHPCFVCGMIASLVVLSVDEMNKEMCGNGLEKKKKKKKVQCMKEEANKVV